MRKNVAILCLFLALVGIPVHQCQAQIDNGTICPCQLRLWSYNPVSYDTGQYGDSISLGLKSPSKALTLSLAGTLIPLPTIVLTLPGIIVGPSLGYFYGGMSGRGWLGIGVRVIGVGGMVSSFALGYDCGPGECEPALLVFVVSGGLTVGSAIYDLATIKSAVRNHNEKLKAGARISIAPKYFSETKAPGIGFTLRF